jgi:hypothetical protein
MDGGTWRNATPDDESQRRSSWRQASSSWKGAAAEEWRGGNEDGRNFPQTTGVLNKISKDRSLRRWGAGGNARAAAAPRPQNDEVAVEFVPTRSHAYVGCDARGAGCVAAAREEAGGMEGRGWSSPLHLSDSKGGKETRNSDTTGFAWDTSEWSLAPDTLELLRHSRPFESDPSSLTSLLEGGGCTDTSPWRGGGGGGGDGGSTTTSLDFDFRGRSQQKTWACSAVGCLQSASRSCSSSSTALCALHRRVRSSVRVAHDTVRWCARCKRAHSLGRAAQHDDDAEDYTHHAPHHPQQFCRFEKASFCSPGMKTSSRSDARAVRGGGGGAVNALGAASFPSQLASLLRRVGAGGGDWKAVGEARSFEVSVDAAPASLAVSVSSAEETSTSTAWSLVKRITTRTNRHDDDTNRRDDDGEEDEELLASVACAMLPGSTRLLIAARTLRGLGSAAPSVLDVAASLPAAGVMGTSIVTVSTFDEVGQCKLRIQLTHSLKAPGSNP